MWKIPIQTDSKIFIVTKTSSYMGLIFFHSLFCGKLGTNTSQRIDSAVPSKTKNCSSINLVDVVLSDLADTLDFDFAILDSI